MRIRMRAALVGALVLAVALPAVPTLLLAGDRDLSTPLEWAKREAAVAPSRRLVVIHGAGHSVQRPGMSATAWGALAAFLTG